MKCAVGVLDHLSAFSFNLKLKPCKNMLLVNGALSQLQIKERSNVQNLSSFLTT